MNSCFRNVDLEIRSISRLEPLIEEMGDRVSVLFYGTEKGRRRLLSVESSIRKQTPDTCLRHLCRIVQSLSPDARKIWDRSRCVFDIGFDFDPNDRSSHFSLDPKTVKRVAALGATLATTCYTFDGLPLIVLAPEF